MKYIFYLFTIFFFSCSSSDNTILVTNSGEAQGSYYHIKYMSMLGEDFHSQVDSILLEVDSSLSIYKDISVISKLNYREIVTADTLFSEVFLAAKKVYTQTEGNFDCSVKPLVNACSNVPLPANFCANPEASRPPCFRFPLLRAPLALPSDIE